MLASRDRRMAVNGSNSSDAEVVGTFGKGGRIAELGQYDDAWRCIGEAITAIETTGERWFEAEVNRPTGEDGKSTRRNAIRRSTGIFRACAHRLHVRSRPNPGNSAPP